MNTKLETMRFDRAGKPIRVPAWFKGSYTEFADLVDKLDVHECSYPNGHCQDKKTNKPCTRTKVAFDACEVHGKVKARKQIRYAKYLDKNLGMRMAEAHIDDELLNISHDIEFLSVRLSQLMERLDSGESENAWTRLRKTWDEFLETQESQAEAVKAQAAAVSIGDEAAKAIAEEQVKQWAAEGVNCIRRIGKIITAASDNEGTWKESLLLSERVARLKQQETSRRREAGLTMSVDQAMALVQGLSSIIAEEVEDKSLRATISIRLAALIGIGAPPTIVSKATPVSPVEVTPDKKSKAPMSVEDMIKSHVGE